MAKLDYESPEKRERNDCLHRGKAYPEESQVCGEAICIICREGEWEEISGWPFNTVI